MRTIKSRIGRVILPVLPVRRRTVDILRHELRAWRTRVGNRLNPGFYAAIRRLRKTKGHSINIGSGGKGKDSWVNIELRRARDTTFTFDIRCPLPLPDGSAKRILIEHTLEHVDFREDVPRMLRDYHRLLESGGTLRVVVPDTAAFLRAYVSGRAENWRELDWDIEHLPDDIYTPMDVLNHIFHQGGEHLYGYDFETLEWALRRAGFESVERMSFGKSIDPELAIDQANHAPYSLYVDAVK